MINALHRLAVPFLTAATALGGLSGCSTPPKIHFDDVRCTTSETNALNIPLLLEFKTTSPTVYHRACDEAKKAAAMTLAGRVQPEQILNTVGATFGQNYIAGLNRRIENGDNADYHRSNLSFYNYFLGKEGYSIETVLNPASFKLCTGKGPVLQCR